jgi:hypothetical protein
MRYTLVNVTFKRCLHISPAQQAASKKVKFNLSFLKNNYNIKILNYLGCFKQI